MREVAKMGHKIICCHSNILNYKEKILELNTLLPKRTAVTF